MSEVDRFVRDEFRRLLTPVLNPYFDRRVKHDFERLEFFAKDTVVRVDYNIFILDGADVGDEFPSSVVLCNKRGKGWRYINDREGKGLFKAIIDASTPIELPARRDYKAENAVLLAVVQDVAKKMCSPRSLRDRVKSEEGVNCGVCLSCRARWALLEVKS